MNFVYDPVNAADHLRKHKISFEEAITVFEGDQSAYTDFDADHSEDEKRFFTIGYSADGKMLYISHTELDGRICIISARYATPQERKLYENSEA